MPYNVYGILCVDTTVDETKNLKALSLFLNRVFLSLLPEFRQRTLQGPSLTHSFAGKQRRP